MLGSVSDESTRLAIKQQQEEGVKQEERARVEHHPQEGSRSNKRKEMQPLFEVAPVRPFHPKIMVNVYEKLGEGVNTVYKGEHIWDTYHKDHIIGAGVYGKVYLASRRNTGKRYAIKKTPCDDNGPLPSTVREIGYLCTLNGYPSVVGISEVRYDVVHNCTWMVMEYVPFTLSKTLSDPKVDVTRQKIILYGILSGLYACHIHKICHRDIKPANILVSAEGIAKLADFGLCRKVTFPSRPYSPETVTMLYRAPEIFHSVKTYSFSVDIWSVGCVMAEMSRKRPLFNGECELSILNDITRKLGDPAPQDFPASIITPCQNPLGPEQELALYVPDMEANGVDLLSRMLTYKPSIRITAGCALTHPYFVDSGIREKYEALLKLRLAP